MRGNTVNNMKLTIIAKIRETPTRFLQPTCSECIWFTLSNEVNLVSMHHLSSTRPSSSDSIPTFSAHVSLPLDHHVANKTRSTLS